MLNRYSPKLGSKISRVPKFTAADFMEKSNSSARRLPERAVIVFSRNLYSILETDLKLHDIDYPYNGYFQESANEETGVMLIRIYPGAPLAAVTVEELSTLGVRKFLLLGTAGSINRRAHIDDVVVCSRAVRDEGTSYHYLKPSFYAYPSAELKSHIVSHLTSSGIVSLTGGSWTTDAPYMETKEEMSEYRKRGVITVEMEASSVFAVSKVRGVHSAAAFAISDELHGDEWTGMKIPEAGFEKLRTAAEGFVKF